MRLHSKRHTEKQRMNAILFRFYFVAAKIISVRCCFRYRRRLRPRPRISHHTQYFAEHSVLRESIALELHKMLYIAVIKKYASTWQIKVLSFSIYCGRLMHSSALISVTQLITHTQNVQLKWVCIFFTENVNCFTVERHPEKVSVRMNNGNESDRDNSSSITKYEEIKVGISANENEVPKCKLLSLRTFTRACNHWLICLQGPPHHSCASPMSQRYSIHTAKSEREKIKYHTYQSVLNTLSLLISFVPCGVARIFLLQCKWIVTLWLQLQCHSTIFIGFAVASRACDKSVRRWEWKKRKCTCSLILVHQAKH